MIDGEGFLVFPIFFIFAQKLEMANPKNLLIAVSGGRSSALMARHIQTHPKYEFCNKLYVFCNTGMERPETFEFLKNIVDIWGIPLTMIEGDYSKQKIGYKIVDFNTADMEAKVFKEMIKHKTTYTVYKSVPNISAPYCSSNMKAKVSKALADEVFRPNNYVTAIGFRKEDMPRRITFAEIKEDKKRIFPLLTDFNPIIGLEELDEFYNNNPFKLKINSNFGNCELCWKKSQKNLVENIKYGTRFVDWFKDIEKEYNSTMFRERKSIEDLVEMAKQDTCIFKEEDSDGCVCTF